MTEAELEQRSGIDQKRIRYYQRGLLAFTLPILARLAHALGLDVVDLVWDLRHPPPVTRYRRVKRLRGQGAQVTHAPERARINTACAPAQEGRAASA